MNRDELVLSPATCSEKNWSNEIEPRIFDKETVDGALDEMKLDVKEYPREAIYKAVYSAKITAYKPA